MQAGPMPRAFPKRAGPAGACSSILVSVPTGSFAYSLAFPTRLACAADATPEPMLDSAAALPLAIAVRVDLAAAMLAAAWANGAIEARVSQSADAETDQRA